MAKAIEKSATDQPSPELSALAFEVALEELESLVARMDEGTLTLEEGLVAYRRGAALVKHCQMQLEAVRDQVQILDGELLRPAGELDGAGSSDAR